MSHGRNHGDHARVISIPHSQMTKQKHAEKDRSEVEEEFIREQKQLHSQGAILNDANSSGYDDAERQHNLHSLEKLGDPFNSNSVTESKHAIKNCQTPDLPYHNIRYGGAHGGFE